MSVGISVVRAVCGRCRGGCACRLSVRGAAVSRAVCGRFARELSFFFFPYRPLVGRDVCVVACFRALRRLTCPVGWAGWLACEGLTGQPFEVVVRFGFVVGRCVVLLCCVVSPDRV